MGSTAEQGGDRLVAALAERIDPEARSRVVVRGMDGLAFLEARLPRPFRAFFTTRTGGESSGVFSSLNLDPRSEDDPALVARNRARIEALIGRKVISPVQVHGLRVVGAAEYLEEPAGGPCDGLTIHADIDAGLAAMLLFADCVPVVLCGEVDMAVIHAGWRGVLGGIVQQGGRALMGAPGTAVIGPSIGPCCFTVDEEVASAFAGRFGSEVVAEDGAALRVDLWAAVTRALSEIAIHPDQIVNPRLCTACNRDLFYSYREEGPVTGRQACIGFAETR